MSDSAPGFPADPGTALQQLLENADELIRVVRTAFATWQEEYPLPTLREEWNAAARQFDKERGWVHAMRDFEYDSGNTPGSEAHHAEIRELYGHTGGAADVPVKGAAAPEAGWQADWHRNSVIVRWRELQLPVNVLTETLRRLRREALRIVGAFPDRPSTKIQSEFDWLLSGCDHLARFCPLEFSSIGERTPAALRTDLEEQTRKLSLLADRIRPAGDPLRDTLAMYQGYAAGGTHTQAPRPASGNGGTKLPQTDPGEHARNEKPEATDLPGRVQLAFIQCEQAANGLLESAGLNKSEVTDAMAYEYLRGADMKLPPKETWMRYVRAARTVLGTQKNKRRGRYTGRSATQPENRGKRRKSDGTG